MLRAETVWMVAPAVPADRLREVVAVAAADREAVVRAVAWDRAD